MTATIAGVATAVHAVTSPPADKVTPGILGFLVIFAMALVVVGLVYSMVGHLRKVRYSPDPAATGAPGDAADGDAGGDSTKDSTKD